MVTPKMRNLFCTLFVILSLALPGYAQPLTPKQLKDEARRLLPKVLAEYQWFHQNPELSNQEVKTAARLSEGVKSLGTFQVTEQVGGTGVVAVLSNGEGPVILYRADMDALPVTERTGLPYASKNPGVMHACGHDIHMASALGVLELMSKHRELWNGTLVFLGQPAEELGTGANAMLADVKLQKIVAEVGQPDLSLAFHDLAGLPTGTVVLREGYMTANVDEVDLIIHGQGGHGAAPHEAVDPIIIASELVLALQTIVSRKLPPGTKAVVTVGSLQAGSKHNIISPQAKLLLTVRSYEPEVRDRILQEIERLATAIASAHSAPRPPEMKVLDPYVKAGYNAPELVQRAREVLSRHFAEENLVQGDSAMIGEDFFAFGYHFDAPNLMLGLGTVDPEVFASTPLEQLPGLHSDRFAPDPESTLENAMIMLTAVLMDAFTREN